MSRYIDADLILYRRDSECGTCTADKRQIDNIRTADVRENVKGEWRESASGQCLICSACGYTDEWKYNFCPNCGADMRGDKS